MKKTICLLLCFLLLSGCTAPAASSAASAAVSSQAASSQPESSSLSAAGSITIKDSLGTELSIPQSPKVVSLYGSYADAWLLAGGTLVGSTEDAVKERGMALGDGVKIVGTVKEPNAEEIIALDPDLVLLSADITPQVELKTTLENAGLRCAYYRVDTFDDYAFQMEQFCAVTGREDLFEQNVTAVGEQIAAVKEKAVLSSQYPSVLLMRAFSSGVKAKTDDELAGAILKELGTLNLADEHPSMLEDLSLEEVISADPDFIFVTTMGDEQKALDYLDSQISQNPAWSGLTAVTSGRYVVLPKDLFHYKPNNKWGDSYEYLAKILFPSLFQ